jgi:type I restriction enzyme S subunit
VTISELDGGTILDSKEHISDLAVAEVMPDPVPAGTLLFSFKLSIGKMAVAGVPLYTNEAIAALTIQDPENLDRDFLYYSLLHQSQGHTDAANHAVLGKVLNKSKVEGIQIPIPPISEQRRIVDILKRADGIRRLRKQAIQTARELIPALFVDMFGDPATNPKGWPVFPLGELLIDVGYGCSTKAAAVASTGVPMLRMGNVMVDGRLDLSSIKYVALSDDEKRKYSLEKGDILFNRTNSKDLVGKTGLWDGRFEAVAASYFIRVRVDRKHLNPTYLWVFMNTRFMKRRLFETARGAIGQANINAKEFKSFTIPLPPLTLQQEYEQRLTQLAAILVQQSSAEETSETSFKSLLHRAFRGEL